MSTQQGIYAASFENCPLMLNKDNYVPWSSRIIRYARSRPNGMMIVESIMNGPYVRRMIATLGDPDLLVPVPESFHKQTDEELTENDIKLRQWEQEKKAKLFNEWEKFTSTDEESIKSYYHHFMQLMIHLKRNKHFPENISTNLKFLNNLQLEWKRHVTIVRKTKNLHEADFTQIYDFLKMNKDEVNELWVERLAKTHDPLALMAHSQNSYNFFATHNDQLSSSTHSQQSFPINNKYNSQPSLNQNFMQPPMISFEDINDPTEAMNAYAGQVAQNQQGYNSWPNGGIQVAQNAVQNAGVQNGGNQNGLVVVPGIANQNRIGNIVAAMAKGIGNRNQARDQLQAEEFDFMAAAGDLDEIEEVNANCILMANLQHASISGTQLDKALVYDTDGSAENDNHVTSVAPSMVKSEGTLKTSFAPNEEIQLSKEKSTIFSLMEEKKRLKHDFKTQEDRFLDKDVDLESKIKDLENILLKRDQTVQTMHMLNPKPNSFYHQDQKMALGYPNPSYLNKAQLKQQSLYNGNLLLEEHEPPAVYDSKETLKLAQDRVFVPQMTKSKEELFLSNVSNMVTVSKMISIPNEDLSDDTTPSVARKFLNEVKNSLVTLQRVVKQKMTLKVHNWSSLAHKKVHKIISHEIAPIINQVDARVQNFEIQFLQEAAKFVRDFKSLAKEADESLDKQKSLELKIERLLKANVSHDIMSIVQNGFVDAYNDMQQKVERLQAQLRDLKGKSSDTPSVSNTLDLLNQKLETNIVELEFQVVNYEREISHLKTTYKNLFDSITSNRVHAKLYNLIYENAKVDSVSNNQSSASSRTNPITNFQRHVTFKENVSADTINASSIGNNHIAAILGYGDLKWGNITITGVYFVECLGHNLFFVGQFCDTDLEVAFRRNTCFIRDLDCVDLLKGKSKRASHPPKPVLNSKQRLHLLYMDLCGPMRVASISGKVAEVLKYDVFILDSQSAIKWWDEYGFVIRLCLVEVTCKSVRIDL
uniref:Integrase, catalytic region, zinc finger, CCHC-type, peptidase aspartic, catalytic n=1 Tax=Tanacetum cinerariifolium TaxID=118510 RepID=A0A6L2K8R4_TANCI|nr:integrase, catalytic region, zinc finger, CCHC-type, peptidase aspartic, catalytic [Tanacetum cinerariifolium]